MKNLQITYSNGVYRDRASGRPVIELFPNALRVELTATTATIYEAGDALPAQDPGEDVKSPSVEERLEAALQRLKALDGKDEQILVKGDNPATTEVETSWLSTLTFGLLK